MIENCGHMIIHNYILVATLLGSITVVVLTFSLYVGSVSQLLTALLLGISACPPSVSSAVIVIQGKLHCTERLFRREYINKSSSFTD